MESSSLGRYGRAVHSGRVVVAGSIAAAVLAGCSGSTKGLTVDQVRPTLASLPFHIKLREVPLDGTKAAFIGTATRHDGGRVGFAVSICNDRQCPNPAVPSFPGIDYGGVVGGTGWAFGDNATTPGVGHTRGQGIATAGQIFLALCHAANDPPCY